MDHAVSFKQKFNAVLSGSCIGTALGILGLIVITAGPGFLADDWVPPQLCTSGAVIVTTFAPDIHC